MDALSTERTCGPHPEGILYAEELLGNHTEHFNVNAVELVKAGPGAGLGQASKELAHEAVIQPLPTVEHHTIHAQGFAQVLLTTNSSAGRHSNKCSAPTACYSNSHLSQKNHS